MVADETADPRLVAADLLGQAEHGPTSPPGVIAIGEDVGAGRRRRRSDELLRDVADRRGRRRGVARPRLGRGRRRRRRGDRARRRRRANEHLEIQVAERQARLLPASACATTARCSSATRRPSPTATRGSGRTTCCRPARAARYTGGLWVGKFLKTCTYQQPDAEGTRAVAPAVEAICDGRGIAGHALTATMRLERAGPR